MCGAPVCLPAAPRVASRGSEVPVCVPILLQASLGSEVPFRSIPASLSSRNSEGACLSLYSCATELYRSSYTPKRCDVPSLESVVTHRSLIFTGNSTDIDPLKFTRNIIFHNPVHPVDYFKNDICHPELEIELTTSTLRHFLGVISAGRRVCIIQINGVSSTCLKCQVQYYISNAVCVANLQNHYLLS